MKHVSQELDIQFGDHEAIIERRYQVAATVNDLLIAIWFLIGSFMFLSPELQDSGVWLFILGSAQLLIRPIIKLTRLIHITQIQRNKRASSTGSRLSDHAETKEKD